MVKKLYSDRENLNNGLRNLEIISIEVHNEVINIIKKYTKSYSKNYPLYCYNDGSSIYGTDMSSFEKSLKGHIPNFEFNYKYSKGDNFNFFEEEETKENIKNKDTISLLDAIEFVYNKITDYEENEKNFHSYFNHYHIKFPTTNEERKKFKEDINFLFKRNKLVYELGDNGEFFRILPSNVIEVIKNIKYIDDQICNNLLNEALEKIMSIRIEERQNAIERLWDAFERVKTYYNDLGRNKKSSIDDILKEISNDCQETFKILEAESKALTIIGNSFRIRHHEKDKSEIISSQILDYLFFRMFSFIALIFNSISKIN